MDHIHPEPAKAIGEVIAKNFERWAVNGAGAVDRDVLGLDEPGPIAEAFSSFCQRELERDVAKGLFYVASAGCVLGAQLSSGEVVVIKAYQRRWGKAFLDAVQEAQRQIAQAGMPCPRPILSARPIRPGRPNLAVVEAWLPDPGMRPGGSAAERHSSASGLAQQVEICRSLDRVERFSDHPLHSNGDGLYGMPHSPLFNFDGTSAGAEWIDDLARRAKQVRDADASLPVVAHTDWSARNVRFDGEGLTAVYDWDSLALVQEATALGQAAMTWSVTADPGGTEFPGLDCVVAYVDDYEEAGRTPLRPGQRSAAFGAAVYTLAYTARCEHALSVQGLARPDQDAAHRRLREIGETLLTIG